MDMRGSTQFKSVELSQIKITLRTDTFLREERAEQVVKIKEPSPIMKWASSRTA